METLMDQAATANEGENQQEATVAPETEAQQPAGEQEAQQQEGEQQEQEQPQGAPEKYELNPGDGKEFDSEFLKTFEETARELDLSNDKAQKLIDKLSPVLEARQLARIEAVKQEWQDTSKADKEFGGDKLNENLAYAKQALDKFGSPELKKMLNETGLGNNPEVIRFFYRAGKAISSDTIVTGHKDNKSDNGKFKTFNDYAERMYGS